MSSTLSSSSSGITLDALLHTAQHSTHLEIPATWGQGRATYGGLVAALLLAHVQGQLGSDRVLRSVTLSFVGPVTASAATLACEVLRTGKSVTQAYARLTQDGQVQAVLLASFGQARDSSIIVPAVHTTPAFAQAEALNAMPYIAGMMPEFLQHIDLRWAEGALPYSGADQPNFAGWMRYKQPSAAFGVAHLLGLIDSWPPAVLPMFRGVAPASTLSWTVEFVQIPQHMNGHDHWQYQVTTDASADGYAHTQAHIWSASGQLVAISRQTVAVFA